MSILRWLLRNVVGRRLPIVQGELKTSHVNKSLRIHRDAWGVPYVEADTDWDAWFGLGFCHGQDRPFQLDLLLRVQRGQLSELVGGDALPIDRLARRIGFCHAAELQLPLMDDDVREILHAYVMGINTGIERGLRGRSHEHVLLRSSPLTWVASDVLALMKLQSFLLSSNWDVELARWMICKLDGPEALLALEPHPPEWLPVSLPMGAPIGESIERLAEEVHALNSMVGVGGGSNQWAVRSSRTSTGRPMLANDPHLSALLPSHWYLAHLRAPEWSVAGATFVGTPTFPAGHNGVAAWGITAGLADNTDLFEEQLNEDRSQVRENGGWAPVERRTETIRVRGGQPVFEEVVQTKRGPIVSPMIAKEETAFSMSATWLTPAPARGLLGLHRVRSFQDLRAVMRDWPFGSMNIAYADTTDTIGWQFVGRIPKRRSGWGLLPASGADPDRSWEEEPVPFEELPYVVCSGDEASNQDENVIATANNPPLAAGNEPYLGVDFMNGYRHALILDKLRGKSDWDVPSTLRLQCDQESRPWQEIRDVILGWSFQEQDANQAQELLRAWDGVLSEDSVGGAVFELFAMEMITRVARAKAPNSYDWALGNSVSPFLPYNFFAFRRMGRLVTLLREQPDGWFEQGWQREVEQALSAVVHRLRGEHGEDKTRWAWGVIRRTTFHHPLGKKPALAPIFNLPSIPFGGDNDTIAQGSVLPMNPLADCDNLPSVRAVMDVGEWSNSRYCLPSGQSGNPFSPHYRDQFPLWLKGEGITMAWTPEEISRAIRSTLTLTPGKRTHKATVDSTD